MKKALLLVVASFTASFAFAGRYSGPMGTKDRPPKCSLPNGLQPFDGKSWIQDAVVCKACPSGQGVKKDGYCGGCAKGEGILSTGACGQCAAGQAVGGGNKCEKVLNAQEKAAKAEKDKAAAAKDKAREACLAKCTSDAMSGKLMGGLETASCRSRCNQ